MKKILLVFVALVFASPAMATVTITLSHVDDTNEVTIGFINDDLNNRVRAFGLNVTLDNDSNIVSVEGLPESGYWVYPGTIVIAADGEITDYGSIAAEYGDLPSDTLPGPPDGNGVTLECASLYAPVTADDNAPPQTGDLAKLIINGTDCQLCVTANVSRAGANGVVMEDPDLAVDVVYACVDVNLPEAGQDECMKKTAPEYTVWEQWGKPKCWCYARQCRGDINGQKVGLYRVQSQDLAILASAFNKMDAVLATVPNGICADINHSKVGLYRVQSVDLGILAQYFNKMDTMVPECDPTNYNFWETP